MISFFYVTCENHMTEISLNIAHTKKIQRDTKEIAKYVYSRAQHFVALKSVCKIDLSGSPWDIIIYMGTNKLDDSCTAVGTMQILRKTGGEHIYLLTKCPCVLKGANSIWAASMNTRSETDAYLLLQMI